MFFVLITIGLCLNLNFLYFWHYLCFILWLFNRHYHNNCEDPLRHRCFLLTPKWLNTWGIYHDVVVQRPNDIIFTLGIGAHQGVNLGPCVNEAVNICVPRWLEFGKRATTCTCGYVVMFYFIYLRLDFINFLCIVFEIILRIVIILKNRLFLIE